MCGAKQQSAAEAPALHGSIDAEAAETEHRHVVTRQAFLREHGCPRIIERGGAQSVEAEDARRSFGRRGDETFCAAAFVVLTRELLQIKIEVGVAAIERGAVVSFGDRRFVPDERRHGSVKPALAARTRRSFPSGEFFEQRENA